MARIASTLPGFCVRCPPENWRPPPAVRAPMLCMLLLAGAAAYTQPAWQPQRPVEIVVGSGPGGGNDRNARVLQKLEWVCNTAEWKRMMAADLQELDFRKSAATRDHLRQQYELTRTLLADIGVTK